jgi:hypothetical protein
MDEGGQKKRAITAPGARRGFYAVDLATRAGLVWACSPVPAPLCALSTAPETTAPPVDGSPSARAACSTPSHAMPCSPVRASAAVLFLTNALLPQSSGESRHADASGGPRAPVREPARLAARGGSSLPVRLCECCVPPPGPSIIRPPLGGCAGSCCFYPVQLAALRLT